MRDLGLSLSLFFYSEYDVDALNVLPSGNVILRYAVGKSPDGYLSRSVALSCQA